jgi:hypothetical protein
MANAVNNNSKEPGKDIHPSSTGNHANKEKSAPKPDSLEAEIGAEIEHGQLTDDELNSGNDI